MGIRTQRLYRRLSKNSRNKTLEPLLCAGMRIVSIHSGIIRVYTYTHTHIVKQIRGKYNKWLTAAARKTACMCVLCIKAKDQSFFGIPLARLYSYIYRERRGRGETVGAFNIVGSIEGEREPRPRGDA